MNEKKKAFITVVKEYYKKHGRHDLPWRQTQDPYRILVSEIMLQQTQVPRVIEKYKEFLKAFPTAKKLAVAQQADVLKLWSGLGYNRRARFLHQCTKALVELKHFPTDVAELEKLSGIGHYTARAVATFAYNQPHVFLETNIRTVYVHHFFDTAASVSDADILALVAETLDTTHPREWYAALMDYGTHLKSLGIRTHRKSTSYTKQSAFVGSNRRIRGLITKHLISESPQTLARLVKTTSCSKEELDQALSGLIREQMVIKTSSSYSLA